MFSESKRKIMSEVKELARQIFQFADEMFKNANQASFCFSVLQHTNISKTDIAKNVFLMNYFDAVDSVRQKTFLIHQLSAQLLQKVEKLLSPEPK